MTSSLPTEGIVSVKEKYMLKLYASSEIVPQRVFFRQILINVFFKSIEFQLES